MCTRVGHEQHFGSLCDTEQQMNPLNWATEAKMRERFKPFQESLLSIKV
jgi:hypothetical protein